MEYGLKVNTNKLETKEMGSRCFNVAGIFFTAIKESESIILLMSVPVIKIYISNI